jgi:hypothetical protein
LHREEQDRDQDGDDRDHHQELDQGESSLKHSRLPSIQGEPDLGESSLQHSRLPSIQGEPGSADLPPRLARARTY